MTYKKRGASVKDRICDAVVKLVSDNKKPYNQITIQEIVDEAGVCRNSFYRNFESLDDVFLYRFQNVAKQTGELLNNYEGDLITRVFYSFFETTRNNRDFLLSFYMAIPNVYFDTFVKTILYSNGITDKKVDTKHFYKSSCKAWVTVGLLTDWMKRGCDTSIDTIVAWFKQWCNGLI